MQKGLQQILESLRDDPGNAVLANRYLALIADLYDGKQKAERTLDLAAVLASSNPREAIRLSHMVFQFDHGSVRALEIIEQSLRAMGRTAKAEAVHNEIGRLLGVHSASLPAAPVEVAPPAAPVMSRPLPRSESGTRITQPPILPETPRAPLLFTPSDGGTAVSQINEWPKHPEIVLDVFSGRHPAAPMITEDLEQPAAEGYVPLGWSNEDETQVAQVKRGPEQSNEPPGALSNEPRNAPPEPQAPRPAPRREAQPRLTTVPQVDQELGVGAELFDYYWRQGFFDEAAALLEQTASLARTQPWWQACRALLDTRRVALAAAPETPKQEAKALGPEPRGEPAGLATTMPPLEPQKIEPREGFWQTMREELALLSVHESLAGAVSVRSVRPAANAVWGSVLAERLKERGADTEAAWNLVSGLWLGTGDRELLSFIETLRLSQASLGFWAAYLDALLQSGEARHALAQIRTTVLERRDMSYARVAWPRLERAWAALELKGFRWTEADGLETLLKGLRSRPLPRFTGLLVRRD